MTISSRLSLNPSSTQTNANGVKADPSLGALGRLNVNLRSLCLSYLAPDDRAMEVSKPLRAEAVKALEPQILRVGRSPRGKSILFIDLMILIGVDTKNEYQFRYPFSSFYEARTVMAIHATFLRGAKKQFPHQELEKIPENDLRELYLAAFKESIGKEFPSSFYESGRGNTAFPARYFEPMNAKTLLEQLARALKINESFEEHRKAISEKWPRLRQLEIGTDGDWRLFQDETFGMFLQLFSDKVTHLMIPNGYSLLFQNAIFLPDGLTHVYLSERDSVQIHLPKSCKFANFNFDKKVLWPPLPEGLQTLKIDGHIGVIDTNKLPAFPKSLTRFIYRDPDNFWNQTLAPQDSAVMQDESYISLHNVFLKQLFKCPSLRNIDLRFGQFRFWTHEGEARKKTKLKVPFSMGLVMGWYSSLPK